MVLVEGCDGDMFTLIGHCYCFCPDMLRLALGLMKHSMIYLRSDLFLLMFLCSAVDTILKQEPLSNGQKMRFSRHYTSRIHVADICQALKASIQRPSPGYTFNNTRYSSN